MSEDELSPTFLGQVANFKGVEEATRRQSDLAERQNRQEEASRGEVVVDLFNASRLLLSAQKGPC
jgi:hypothetical protein